MHTKLELPFYKLFYFLLCKEKQWIYLQCFSQKKMYNLFKFSHNLKAIEMFEISKLQTFFLQ